MSMFLRVSFTCLLVTTILVTAGQAQTDATARISLQERVYIASRVYSTIQSYFNVWEESDIDFDQSYRNYLQSIFRSDDRREFDLETMRFVALLHNGHTWFNDRWLQETYGAPLGFYTEPIEGKWLVTRSDLPQLQLGDVVAYIDGEPIEDFFQQNRQFLSDSNERSQRTDLFTATYLFPQQFALTLGNGRKVNIIRTPDVNRARPDEQVTGHWLESSRFAYMRIPSFRGGVAAESADIALVRKFRDADGLIIDLRGNPGGVSSVELQVALMGRPFRSWRESSGRFSSSRGNRAELIYGADQARPYRGIESGIYVGPLVILIDAGCASACEDFVMPFKDSHRATLIGETTFGSFSDTYFSTFDNGMMLNTATTRVVFPDGNPFEGVGISPDIAVAPTADDIRARNDVALKRAIEILRTPQE
jgi:carboxyl-terminal processing protease